MPNIMKSPYGTDWPIRGGAVVTPRRREGVVTERLGGEVIVCDLASRNRYRLDRMALVVWRRCDGWITSLQIAWQLTDDYDLEFETALDLVDGLLVQFAETGLIFLDQE